MDDVISRKWLMECVEEGWIKFETEKDENKFIHLVRDTAPSAQSERLSNAHWVDFLSAQFDISRTSAKEMLHGMMRWKKEDNFKKQFSGSYCSGAVRKVE